MKKEEPVVSSINASKEEEEGFLVIAKEDLEEEMDSKTEEKQEEGTKPVEKLGEGSKPPGAEKVGEGSISPVQDEKQKADEMPKLPSMPTMNSSKAFKALETMKPVIEACVTGFDKALPHMEKAYYLGLKYWELYLEPFWSNDLAELFLGIVLLFFGGNFALTIACYTAIRFSGWDELKTALYDLWDTYKVAREAINKDMAAQLDTNGDGTVSASEIAKALRKPENVNLLTMTLLKALDPNKLMAALKGIWIVLLSVMATLRSQFAQQIAIGANIANVLQDMLNIYAKDALVEFLQSYNPTYVKWSDFIIVTISRVICICISMMLTRIMTAYNSALKGGEILARVVRRILDEQGFLDKDSKVGGFIGATDLQVLVMQLLAAYGFYSQFVSGFRLGFPLNLILAPAVMLEGILSSFAYYAI